MSELGQLLRKARMDRGISLEDLQETTKIRKRYLEAIEDGNYKLLPGNFYVRAFIKSYSECVGLDPNEVLQLYRNVIPVSQIEPSKAETNHRKRSGIKTNDRWSKRITTLVFIAFLVFIVALVYYFTDKNSNSTKSPNNAEVQDDRLTDKAVEVTDPNATPLATIEPNTPTPEPSSPIVEVKLASSTNGVDYYTVSNVTSIELELSVAEDDCWFEIDEVNGPNKKLIETGTIKTTTGTKVWNVEHPIYLKLGRANAAEVKVNGLIIPVGDLPNVKKFQFELA